MKKSGLSIKGLSVLELGLSVIGVGITIATSLIKGKQADIALEQKISEKLAEKLGK